MKNIKTIILFFWMAIGLASLMPSISANAQPVRIDSSITKHYASKLDTALAYQTQWYQGIASFEEASKGFCYFQQTDKNKANKIIDLATRASFLPKDRINIFYLKNIGCFDEEQKRKIRNQLNQTIQPTDLLFHEMVTLFQLSAHRSSLENKLTTSELSGQLQKDLTLSKLKKEQVWELRNKATQASLGDRELEDQLLLMIKNLYHALEKTEHRGNNNFASILNNTIPLLHSKKSIIQTLYLLDQVPSPMFKGQDDITSTDPSYDYFLSYIQPKLKSWKIKQLAWSNFKKNKNQIKDMIINDNSIWQDHINIENK